MVRVSAIDHLLIWISAISFIVFGCGCFVSSWMEREYRRYGLPGFRKLVGILQLLGSVGLIVGFLIPWVGQSASSGLALLMLGGVGVRLKIKDSVLQTLPAIAYLVLSAYLAIAVY